MIYKIPDLLTEKTINSDVLSKLSEAQVTNGLSFMLLSPDGTAETLDYNDVMQPINPIEKLLDGYYERQFDCVYRKILTANSHYCRYCYVDSISETALKVLKECGFEITFWEKNKIEITWK